MRTPKCDDPALFSQVLRVVWQETVLLVGLVAAMISMGFDRGFEDPAVSLWMVMLGVQSLPYAATFVTASVSAMSNKKAAGRAGHAGTGPDPKPLRAAGGTVFPGLRMFLGSSACFSARIASSSSLDL